MTTPTANKSTSKVSPVTEKAENSTPDVKDVEGTPKSRIPEALAASPILGEICSRYLEAVDEITKYNREVLADKDAEWNVQKVLDKARTLARPTEKGAKANTKIKSALESWEKLIDQVTLAKKAVVEATAEELGIKLSATAERNPELEIPLKEKRKLANEIGSQLSMMAEFTNDANAKTTVTQFLEQNPLPAIGRDQVRTFGNDGGTTPKYRVTIEVKKDDEVLLTEKGFTKTALALTKPAFGYERGKAPKSEDFRKAWEAAGNTPDKTVQSPVEFDDNGLHFTITKN